MLENETLKKIAKDNVENSTLRMDCNLCGGLCCVNPPQLVNMEELNFALKQDVDIMMLDLKNNRWLVTLETVNKKCPFLDTKNFECSVYKNRFNSCKEFKCEALKNNNLITVEELLSLDFLRPQDDEQVVSNGLDNTLKLSNEEIKKLMEEFPNKIKQVTIEEMVEKNALFSISDIEEQLRYTIENIVKNELVKHK
jgi:Fe-S-cluster containining protein